MLISDLVAATQYTPDCLRVQSAPDPRDAGVRKQAGQALTGKCSCRKVMLTGREVVRLQSELPSSDIAEIEAPMILVDTIRLVLKQKGHQIWQVSPEASVYEAIELMADKSAGALMVISEGALVGVLSERDYARKVILEGKSSKQTPVKEIMTTPAIFVTPDQTVEEGMRIMTEKHIRHLPVVEKGEVLGVVSIGDLVKWIISAQEHTISQLNSYISSTYPG